MSPATGVCGGLVQRGVDLKGCMHARAEAGEPVQGEEEARRQRLANLFYAMDTDLNGVLDVEEFREAMRQVGGGHLC